jgi:hypothetical protein
MQLMFLPSNACTEYYPDNKPSNYTVKLAKSVESYDLECALTEIILPNRLINVREGLNDVNVYRLVGKKGFSGSLKKTDKIPVGHYSSISNVVDAVNKVFSQHNITKDGVQHRVLQASFLNDKNRVQIETTNNYAISFGADLAYLLGFKIKNVSEKNYGLIKDTQIGENDASITGGLNNIYVYTDIIKELTVGGVNAPLLRIVNLSMKTNDEGSTSKAYDELYYHPLKSSYVETINIQLRDELGELVHFDSGTVVVTLSFRQTKKAI